jgi:hypothetical protein
MVPGVCEMICAENARKRIFSTSHISFVNVLHWRVCRRGIQYYEFELCKTFGCESEVPARSLFVNTSVFQTLFLVLQSSSTCS